MFAFVQMSFLYFGFDRYVAHLSVGVRSCSQMFARSGIPEMPMGTTVTRTAIGKSSEPKVWWGLPTIRNTIGNYNGCSQNMANKAGGVYSIGSVVCVCGFFLFFVVCGNVAENRCKCVR